MTGPDGDQVDRGTPRRSEDPEGAARFASDHARRYVESGGREGHDEVGAPTLLLTTIGRRSGEPRHNVAIYGRDGSRYVLVASKGGAAHNPLWFENLRADPKVDVQVGTARMSARARIATGAERQRLWTLMTGVWPLYAEYQRLTDRQLPVVVLDITSTSSG